MKYYIVKYTGQFGFIKPWSAVRDSQTFSQQFLTPSIVEGIEKKLFPELLNEKGIFKIKRNKLSYSSMSSQQEVTQPRGWNKKSKSMERFRSILVRDVMVNPVLVLAFEKEEEALSASKQHICLCRNEDVMLPDPLVVEMTDEEFNDLKGFELRFGESDSSFLVGYNRFNESEPMYGRIEFDGKSILENE
ncbi:MAG: hypothetical protein MJ211_05705 [Bacteroidales bacterium]|nr:hypothetical protein [Bacteroidales bacterium]